VQDAAGWVEAVADVVEEHFFDGFLGWLVVSVVWDLLEG